MGIVYKGPCHLRRITLYKVTRTHASALTVGEIRLCMFPCVFICLCLFPRSQDMICSFQFIAFLLCIYCYDITEQSMCFSNVPVESGCNVCAYVILNTLATLCQKLCSHAYCVKAAMNYALMFSFIADA